MDLRDRPGANLLRLLEERGRELGEFAVAVGMAADPRHAVANIRRYTHATNPRWPTPEMVERWALELEIDPKLFYVDPLAL